MCVCVCVRARAEGDLKFVSYPDKNVGAVKMSAKLSCSDFLFAQITDRLQLTTIQGRSWRIQPCSAIMNEGIKVSGSM